VAGRGEIAWNYPKSESSSRLTSRRKGYAREPASMYAFLVTRLLRTILVIGVATMMGFTLVAALPGERLTNSSTLEGRQTRAVIPAEASLSAQLTRYVGAMLRGDLGQSASESRPVRTVLRDALPATLVLAGAAFVLSALIGIGLGSWAGWHRHDGRARAVGASLLVIYTLPDVVLGTVGLSLLATQWPILPAGGLADPRIALTGSSAEQFVDRLRHLVLPATVLALSWSAALFRQQRQAVAQLAQSPALQVARAKGLAVRQLLWTHTLPQASLGTLALLGALLPALVGGAVVVETLFAWPGMGRLMVHAVAVRDAPLLAGGLVCVATVVALASVATEATARWLDPRLRVHR
jgi:peptide/nickel transport system permease protein